MPPLRAHMPHETPDLPHAHRAALHIPMPKGPLGATSVCTVAIALIGTGAANMVVGAQVGDLGMARTFWTLGCVLVGAVLIYVFKCHSMLTGGMGKGGI